MFWNFWKKFWVIFLADSIWICCGWHQFNCLGGQYYGLGHTSLHLLWLRWLISTSNAWKKMAPPAHPFPWFLCHMYLCVECGTKDRPPIRQSFEDFKSCQMHVHWDGKVSKQLFFSIQNSDFQEGMAQDKIATTFLRFKVQINEDQSFQMGYITLFMKLLRSDNFVLLILTAHKCHKVFVAKTHWEAFHNITSNWGFQITLR